MPNELDVLRIVTERLGRLEIPFMLTGSLAMAYYATPRMTRDLDLVVALQEADVGKLLGEFASDFYVDADAARDAVRSGRDVRALLADTVDRQYLRLWAADLGVSDLLERLSA